MYTGVKILPNNKSQNISFKEKIVEAVKKVELNLSEITALNNKFGMNLEYTPKNNMVEITCYVNKNSENMPDNFIDECYRIAEFMTDNIFGMNLKIVQSNTKSYLGNLNSALSKIAMFL